MKVIVVTGVVQVYYLWRYASYSRQISTGSIFFLILCMDVLLFHENALDLQFLLSHFKQFTRPITRWRRMEKCVLSVRRWGKFMKSLISASFLMLAHFAIHWTQIQYCIFFYSHSVLWVPYGFWWPMVTIGFLKEAFILSSRDPLSLNNCTVWSEQLIKSGRITSFRLDDTLTSKHSKVVLYCSHGRMREKTGFLCDYELSKYNPVAKIRRSPRGWCEDS